MAVLGPHLSKLVSLASDPLSLERAQFSAPIGVCGEQLGALLRTRNGFYGFESALVVRPSCSSAGSVEIGLEEWNEPKTWIGLYGQMPSAVYFAEDLFGVQFGFDVNGVFSFDPETGERSGLAADLEGWASVLLDDYDAITGHSLARLWQTENGPIPPRKRLVPRVPFVLGGEFNLKNLYLADLVDAMRFRADLARQVRGVADGVSVVLKVT